MMVTMTTMMTNDGDNDDDDDDEDDDNDYDDDNETEICTQMKGAHSSVRLAMASLPGK